MAPNCIVLPTATLALAGVIETRATAADDSGTTVIVEVPVCPSAVAEMVAVPAEIPATIPEVVTEATMVEEVDQVMGRPCRVLPAASIATALNCVAPPTFTLAVAGVTATRATAAGTGVNTVILALPCWLSDDAVMVAAPGATATTVPADVTDAIAFEVVDQVIDLPCNALPAASRATAANCTEPPTSSVALVGETETRATGVT